MAGSSRRSATTARSILALLVLLQGENDRDPERELIDNVLLSCCTQLLRTSSPPYGVQELSIFVRSAGWGGSSTLTWIQAAVPGEVIYAGVPLDDIRDGIVSINPSIWRLRSSWAISCGARPPDSRGAQGLLLLRGRFDQQSL